MYASRPPQSGAPSSAAREQRLEDRRRCRRRRRARPANSANSPTQAFSSLAPLLQCTIATRSPAGVVTRSSSRCTRLSSLLEHDHREDAGAGADVAGARRDRVGGHHAGAGVALGRAHRRAGPQPARRVEQLAPGLGERRRPARPATQDRRQQVGQPQLGAGFGGQAVEPCQHRRVVAAGVDVDREHAAGVADAEHLLAGQLPVHVAGQGGQVADRGRRAPRRSRIAWYRCATLHRCGMLCPNSALSRSAAVAGVGVAPRPERGQQLAVGVEGEIAVHHRRHAERARPWSARRRSRCANVGGQRGVAALQRRPRPRPASRSRSGRRTGSPSRGCPPRSARGPVRSAPP